MLDFSINKTAIGRIARPDFTGLGAAVKGLLASGIESYEKSMTIKGWQELCRIKNIDGIITFLNGSVIPTDDLIKDLEVIRMRPTPRITHEEV